MPSIKLFSVEQAERSLPLVRRIATDIAATFKQYEALRIQRAQLGEPLAPGSKKEDLALEIENKLHAVGAEMLRYQEELYDLGVELKDYHLGLVDWYSRYQDRLVYLCWKLGEGERIAWWHDLNAGFRGRAPISEENRALFEGKPAPVPR